MLDVPLEYTISGWPAYYPWAKEELKAMVKSHHVNYLKAYDMHGWLIEPHSYQKYLQGHWSKYISHSLTGQLAGGLQNPLVTISLLTSTP
jgi:hypothetical protein